MNEFLVMFYSPRVLTEHPLDLLVVVIEEKGVLVQLALLLTLGVKERVGRQILYSFILQLSTHFVLLQLDGEVGGVGLVHLLVECLCSHHLGLVLVLSNDTLARFLHLSVLRVVLENIGLLRSLRPVMNRLRDLV